MFVQRHDPEFPGLGLHLPPSMRRGVLPLSFVERCTLQLRPCKAGRARVCASYCSVTTCYLRRCILLCCIVVSGGAAVLNPGSSAFERGYARFPTFLVCQEKRVVLHEGSEMGTSK